MVRNAGTATVKRDKVNPKTINSHESYLRSRIANPEDSKINEMIEDLKKKIKAEKMKLLID